MHYMVVIPV